jgi:hypothetical protein
MLHKVGDETVARCYVVQDFIMPSPASAASLIESETAPPSKLGIWPLWLCPVRHVALPGAGGAGYGFPYTTSAPGCVWINVGVYGVPLEGKPFDPSVVNGKLEKAVTRLGGRKMLYAQSFYARPKFDALFNTRAYNAARRAYAAVVEGGADFAFPDAATKLLLGDARRARLEGVKPASLMHAWKPMVPWYFSLWGEWLLPRAIHANLGVANTGMTVTPSLAAEVVTEEAAKAAAERATFGTRFARPADPAATRGGALASRTASGKLSPANVKAALSRVLSRSRSGTPGK